MGVVRLDQEPLFRKGTRAIVDRTGETGGNRA